MKILLVQLYIGRGETNIYPLGIAMLSAELKEHEVKIFDPNISSEPLKEFQDLLISFKPDAVGISIRNIRFYSRQYKRYFFYYEDLYPLIDSIKKADKKITIIAGGAGFSMFPKQVMEANNDIDFGIYLEGEKTLPDLLENITAPEKVKGIYYRKDGQVCFTGQGDLRKDFTRVRWENLNPGLYAGELEGVGILSKRGCMLKCLYCNYPFLMGSSIRLRPVNEVVDEVEKLYSEYNVSQFAFADTVFNIPQKHAEDICTELINRKLPVKWTAWFNEEKLDKPFIDHAISAGCVVFQFSPDAYTNKCLNRLKKNISTKNIINTLRLIRSDKRIKASYNFMIGVPDENLFDIIRMMLFCLRLKLCLGKQLDKLIFTKLRIEPNTGLEEFARARHIISDDSNLILPTLYPSVVNKLKFFQSGYIKQIRKIVHRILRRD